MNLHDGDDDNIAMPQTADPVNEGKTEKKGEKRENHSIIQILTVHTV